MTEQEQLDEALTGLYEMRRLCVTAEPDLRGERVVTLTHCGIKPEGEPYPYLNECHDEAIIEFLCQLDKMVDEGMRTIRWRMEPEVKRIDVEVDPTMGITTTSHGWGVYSRLLLES